MTKTALVAGSTGIVGGATASLAGKEGLRVYRADLWEWRL
jgi:hypothetical protein